MNDNDIKIRISYKLRNREQIYHLELTPAQYFDPLEADETYYTDGIAKYNSTWEYLPHVVAEELEWSTKEIKGTCNDKIFHTIYLKNSQVNSMTHIKTPTGYEEIILNTEINAHLNHTIRICKVEGKLWQMNSNIVHYDSGTPEEYWESFLKDNP